MNRHTQKIKHIFLFGDLTGSFQLGTEETLFYVILKIPLCCIAMTNKFSELLPSSSDSQLCFFITAFLWQLKVGR